MPAAVEVGLVVKSHSGPEPVDLGQQVTMNKQGSLEHAVTQSSHPNSLLFVSKFETPIHDGVNYVSPNGGGNKPIYMSPTPIVQGVDVLTPVEKVFVRPPSPAHPPTATEAKAHTLHTIFLAPHPRVLSDSRALGSLSRPRALTPSLSLSLSRRHSLPHQSRNGVPWLRCVCSLSQSRPSNCISYTHYSQTRAGNVTGTPGLTRPPNSTSWSFTSPLRNVFRCGSERTSDVLRRPQPWG